MLFLYQEIKMYYATIHFTEEEYLYKLAKVYEKSLLVKILHEPRGAGDFLVAEVGGGKKIKINPQFSGFIGYVVEEE
jgi:hypothetical protein